MRDDLRAHRGAGQERHAGLDLLAVGDQENVAQGQLRARVALKAIHGQKGTLFDAILLSAAADDCIHGETTQMERSSGPPPDVPSVYG